MSDQPTEGNRPLNRLFKMAVMAGVEDSVRLHIQRGDDINACDDKGLTPLMIAASRNRASTCRLLLDSGADARLLNAAGLDALLLRAVREDSVPLACVDDLCRGDDQDLDQAAESRLHLVISNLGAETDERIEYTAPSESFAVHVDPDETPDEAVIAVTMLHMPQGIDR